jgi:hypothetical protein
MTFEGCIVVQLGDREWHVCVPPVAQGNEYFALTKPLSRADAFKVCKELNTLEEADWSEVTRKAVINPPPRYRLRRVSKSPWFLAAHRRRGLHR